MKFPSINDVQTAVIFTGTGFVVVVTVVLVAAVVAAALSSRTQNLSLARGMEAPATNGLQIALTTAAAAAAAAITTAVAAVAAGRSGSWKSSKTRQHGGL